MRSTCYKTYYTKYVLELNAAKTMLLSYEPNDDLLNLDCDELYNPDGLDINPLIKTIMNANYPFSTTNMIKPIETWSSEDVLTFIHNEIDQNFLDNSSNDLHRFKCISGYIFKTLTIENCKLLSGSPYLGEIIFNAKENYLQFHRQQEDNIILSHAEDLYSKIIDNSEDFYSLQAEESNFNLLSDQVKSTTERRPKLNFDKKSGKQRSEKLWEFLLHLLQDAKTCPHLIKWENFSEGTFKFVQSNQVARLWGRRKQNENMTYEKFSRAMRYYYKSQVLLPVPGRRLVYKFGPRAKGWNNILPIC